MTDKSDWYQEIDTFRRSDLSVIREQFGRFKYYKLRSCVFSGEDVCGLFELIENLIKTEEKGNLEMARALMKNNE